MNSKERTRNFILAVDDSKTQLEQLCGILSRAGFTVTGVSSAEEALAYIRTTTPSLIISDILMPGMDGYALCTAIRNGAICPEIPIVLLTSLSGPQDILKALECGADYFVTKPYNEAYLLDRMDNIVDSLAHRHVHSDGEGTEIVIQGTRYRIKADMQRVLDLLISTYEFTVIKNNELLTIQNTLASKLFELETAMKQIQALEGIIPICMYCKKIRDDKQYWHQLEAFICEHSKAQFSHGICPDCCAKEMELLKNEWD